MATDSDAATLGGAVSSASRGVLLRLGASAVSGAAAAPAGPATSYKNIAYDSVVGGIVTWVTTLPDDSYAQYPNNPANIVDYACMRLA